MVEAGFTMAQRFDFFSNGDALRRKCLILLSFNSQETMKYSLFREPILTKKLGHFFSLAIHLQSH